MTAVLPSLSTLADPASAAPALQAATDASSLVTSQGIQDFPAILETQTDLADIPYLDTSAVIQMHVAPDELRTTLSNELFLLSQEVGRLRSGKTKLQDLSADKTTDDKQATLTGDASVNTQVLPQFTPAIPSEIAAMAAQAIQPSSLPASNSFSRVETGNTDEAELVIPGGRKSSRLTQSSLLANTPEAPVRSSGIQNASHASTGAHASSSAATSFDAQSGSAPFAMNVPLDGTPQRQFSETDGMKSAQPVLSSVQTSSADSSFSPIQLPGQTASSTPTVSTVQTPVGSQSWAQEFGTQFTQLATQQSRLSLDEQGRHRIELKLHPAELGPLQIVMTVQDGLAHAAFSSQHANVRQSVEAALPQLQQALSSAGLTLGQASVGDGQHPQGNESHGNQTASLASSISPDQQSSDTTDVIKPGTPSRPVRSNALLDTFA